MLPLAIAAISIASIAVFKPPSKPNSQSQPDKSIFQAKQALINYALSYPYRKKPIQ